MPTFPVDLFTITVVIACTTAALGGWLALAFLLPRPLPACRCAAWLHGAGAAVALAAIVVLQYGGTEVQSETAPGPDFVAVGSWLLFLAAGMGAVTLAARRQSRVLRGAAMGAHAGLAVFGVVALLASAQG